MPEKDGLRSAKKKKTEPVFFSLHLPTEQTAFPGPEKSFPREIVVGL